MSELIFLGSVFSAGLFSFFSPCVIPLLPVFFAMFSSDKHSDKVNKKIVITRTFLFVFGISISFIILGFGAGMFSQLIRSDIFSITLGIIVIVLGIHQMGIIKIPALFYDKKIALHYQGSNEYVKSFLFGFTFSFGWTPCIGPILAAILGLAATQSNVAYSLLLIILYALGFLIPFMVLAFFSETLLVKVNGLKKHMKTIKIISGIIIIFMGFLLMSNQLNYLVTLFT